MTKSNSKFSQLKKVLVVPAMFALAFLFVQKTYASESNIAEVVKKPAISNLNEEILPVITSKINDDKIENNLNILKNDTIKKPIAKKIEKAEAKEIPLPPSPPNPPSFTANESPTNETPAEFPGGMSVFRKKIMENMDVSKIKSRKEPYKGTVEMMVSEDGSEADFFMNFDDEDFQKAVGDAVTKTLKGVQWKPGTKDGKPSKSYLRIPIQLNIE